MVERLRAVAIKRGDHVHSFQNGDAGGHKILRGTLATPNLPGDIEGFVTTENRFVDRAEAKQVALAAGQIHSSWKTATRALLSSDVNWNPPPPGR